MSRIGRGSKNRSSAGVAGERDDERAGRARVLRHEDGDAEGAAHDGGRQHGLWRAEGDERAAGEDGDAVGVLRGEVEVVEDGQHADASGGLGLRHAQHGVLVREVERARGLVEQEVARGRGPIARGLWRVELREGAREVDALLLAARERGVAPRSERQHAGPMHGALGSAEVGGLRRAVRRAAEEHDVERGEPERQRGLLREHGAPPREGLWRRLRQRLPVEQGVAAGGGRLAREHAERRRLARAVGADDGDDLARGDAQREVVEQRGGADADRDVVEGEHLSRGVRGRGATGRTGRRRGRSRSRWGFRRARGACVPRDRRRRAAPRR